MLFFVWTETCGAGAGHDLNRPVQVSRLLKRPIRMNARIKLWTLLSVVAACFGCNKPANPPAVPQSKPLIQPAKIEPPAQFKPSRKAALPYFEKSTIEAYRKIGAHNPKRDANAEVALKLWAYQICEEGSVACGPEFKEMRAATAQALKDGRVDPLVMNVCVRTDRTSLDLLD